MANPKPPFDVETIEEAVQQARAHLSYNLTNDAYNRLVGFWVPMLLAKIDALEAERADMLTAMERATVFIRWNDHSTDSREVLALLDTTIAKAKEDQ